MNISILNNSTNIPQQHFEKRRRRSNSSSQILARQNFKAVRGPRRDDTDEYSLPGPPRLAFDPNNAYLETRITMTPPSRPEYGLSHMLYSNRNDLLSRTNSDRRVNYQRGQESHYTKRSHRISDSSLLSSLDFHERIQKRTSMAFEDEDDDECDQDPTSDASLSCSSSVFSDEVDDSEGVKLADQISLLRKEIASVKESLAGLQKDHKEMLHEKKELEEQYQQTKNEVAKTIEESEEMLNFQQLLNSKVDKLSLDVTQSSSPSSDRELSDEDVPPGYEDVMNNCMQQAKELNLLQTQLEDSKSDFKKLLSIKEDIEQMLELKERVYLERIRECEAVTNGQAGMINSMEALLVELEAKMDKLTTEQIERGNRHGSSCSSTERKSKRKERAGKSIKIDEVSAEDLIPTYLLSPPQTRRVTYTNPISLLTDEELVRHQSRFGLAKRWVEDKEVSICQQAGCSVRFNLWNRRHHCRRCGNIFCRTHSAYSMLLFPDGREDWGGVWSRVCEGCFTDKR